MTPGGPPPSHIHPEAAEAAAAAAATGGVVGEWRHGMAWHGMAWYGSPDGGTSCSAVEGAARRSGWT